MFGLYAVMEKYDSQGFEDGGSCYGAYVRLCGVEIRYWEIKIMVIS